MKKALILVLALILCLSLCACGSKSNKPSGSYSATIAGVKFSTFIFSGDKVTYEGASKTSVGSFTMDENKVIITYDDGLGEELEYDPKTDTLSLGDVMTFEKD